MNKDNIEVETGTAVADLRRVNADGARSAAGEEDRDGLATAGMDVAPGNHPGQAVARILVHLDRCAVPGAD